MKHCTERVKAGALAGRLPEKISLSQNGKLPQKSVRTARGSTLRRRARFM